MIRPALLLAFCCLTPVAAGAQPADLPGWEQTRWGMSAEDLAMAVGPGLVVRQLGNGGTDYSLVGFSLGGQTFDVRFVWDFAGRLAEVVVGSGFVATNRMEAAATLEAALVDAHGRFTHVIVDEDVNDGDARIVTRRLQWLLPTTTIVVRHAMTASPEGIFDALTVRYFPTP